MQPSNIFEAYTLYVYEHYYFVIFIINNESCMSQQVDSSLAKWVAILSEQHWTFPKWNKSVSVGIWVECGAHFVDAPII